jgi:hypothetical protein
MIHKNDLSPYGFAATYTEEEMIALAMKHGSRIVVKNGKKGKWLFLSHFSFRSV